MLLGALAFGLLLTAASAPLGNAAFPGASGKIAFSSDRDGNPEIYVMNADGSNQTRLTFDPASDDGPVWSPDGTKIAFQSNRDGNFEIYVMNADGSNQIQVTNDPGIAFTPTWSPDGAWIAFTSTRNGGYNTYDIFKIHPDGTGEVPLATTPNVQETYPAWAPDNSKLVYNRHTFCCDRDLFTMNPDGSGQTLLPPSLLPQGIDRTHPDWSPDAQKVIFDGDRPGTGYQIFMTNADGTGGVIELTAGEPSFSSVNPAFSPDGSKIIFNSSRDGNAEIYVMNADGSGQTRLTNNSAGDTSPDWQADSTPPTITVSATSNGVTYTGGTWTNQDVVVHYSCTDAASGVASLSADQTVTDEGAGQSRTGVCTDNAGNSATATFSDVQIDKTAAVLGSCPAGGPFAFGTGTYTVGPIGFDAGVSGLDAGASTLSGSVDTSWIGTRDVVFTATDNAANTASTTCPYVVRTDLAKVEVLNQLNAALATATKKNDVAKLKEASKKLSESLDPVLWVDGDHLATRGGERVFDKEKDAVQRLVELVKDRSSGIPGATLQGWIDSLLSVDRTLALTAIGDAVLAGGDARKIAEAGREMQAASHDLVKGKYAEAIDHYKTAWRKSQEAVRTL